MFIIRNIDIVFVNVLKIILREYSPIFLSFKQVQHPSESFNIFEKLLPICFNGHQNHRKDVLGKFGPLCKLESSEYASVIHLRFGKVAQYLVAQGSKVTEVNLAPRIRFRWSFRVLIAQLGDRSAEVISCILGFAILELAESVPIVSI